MVSISVGDADTLSGGSVYISAGASTAAATAASYNGGSVEISPGSSANGAEGAVYLNQYDGTAIVTASATTFTVDNTGTVSVTATTTASLTAGTTMTLSAATAVDFSSSFVKGFSTGTAAVSGSDATVNQQAGVITSATTDLAAGSSDTFTLTNSYISSTSLVFVTVKETCTGGYVVVTEAAPDAGSANVVVYNAGTAACSTAYTLHFLVINNS